MAKVNVKVKAKVQAKVKVHVKVNVKVTVNVKVRVKTVKAKAKAKVDVKAKVKAGVVVDVFGSSDAPIKAKALKPRLNSPGLMTLPSREARRAKARANPKEKEKERKERKEKEKGSSRETNPTVHRWAKVNPMKLLFSHLILPLRSPLIRLQQQPQVPLKVQQTGHPLQRRALMSGCPMMIGTGGSPAGKKQISPTTLRTKVGMIKAKTGPGIKVKVSPGSLSRGTLLQLVFPRIHQQRSGIFSKSLLVIFLSRMPSLLGIQTSMVQLTLVRTQRT